MGTVLNHACGRPTLLALLLTATLLWPLAAQAHGGGVPFVTNEAAGPYSLYAWMNPDPLRTGEVHFSIGVVQRDENGFERPVSDAEVTVLLHAEQHNEQTEVAPLELTARPDPSLGGVYYEVDAVIERAGRWTVEIVAAGDEGTGSVTYPIELEATRPTYPIAWIGAGTLLALLLWLGRTLLTSKPTARRRGAAHT